MVQEGPRPITGNGKRGEVHRLHDRIGLINVMVLEGRTVTEDAVKTRRSRRLLSSALGNASTIGRTKTINGSSESNSPETRRAKSAVRKCLEYSSATRLPTAREARRGISQRASVREAASLRK